MVVVGHYETRHCAWNRRVAVVRNASRQHRRGHTAMPNPQYGSYTVFRTMHFKAVVFIYPLCKMARGLCIYNFPLRLLLFIGIRVVTVALLCVLQCKLSPTCGLNDRADALRKVTRNNPKQSRMSYFVRCQFLCRLRCKHRRAYRVGLFLKSGMRSGLVLGEETYNICRSMPAPQPLALGFRLVPAHRGTPV